MQPLPSLLDEGPSHPSPGNCGLNNGGGMPSTAATYATSKPRRQGIFWILTIPRRDFVPDPNTNLSWIRGQLEIGESGYEHWQLLVAFPKKVSIRQVKGVFGKTCHAELSRSSAAAVVYTY